MIRGCIDGQSYVRKDQIQELAQSVVKISKGLPIVLAVDDAHWADPTLTSFLDVILQSHGAHVLIVATCWPETADDLVEEGSFGAWCESLQSETVTRIALEPLGQQDLLTLVRAVYSSVAHDDDPVLGDEIAEVLIERFSSPIGIRAFFGLDAVQRAIHSGGLERGDLDVLPATLDKVMDDYWNELPPEVQQVSPWQHMSVNVCVTSRSSQQLSSWIMSDPGVYLQTSKRPPPRPRDRRVL